MMKIPQIHQNLFLAIEMELAIIETALVEAKTIKTTSEKVMPSGVIKPA